MTKLPVIFKLAAAIVGLGAALLVNACAGPLVKSEAQMEDELFQATPVGTPMTVVEANLGQPNWKGWIIERDDQHGFLDQSRRWQNLANYQPGALDDNALQQFKIRHGVDLPAKADGRPKLAALPPKPIYLVGDQHITARMEYHTLPFVTLVEVDWGFDAQSRLVDIYVGQWIEGL